MTRACKACHNAKTKCTGGIPCDRCIKFQLECLPHVSRQGQGKRQRTTKSKENIEEESSTTEDAVMMEQLSMAGRRDHYGLRYLIHSWISIAIRRRSFSLLSRASKLAAQLEMPMDNVLNTTMGFLTDILLRKGEEQVVIGPGPLQWVDIPSRLLEATGATPSDRNDRWILIREMDQGMSRYLISNAFARDIASLELVNETWQKNQQSVVDLFLESAHSRNKHSQAFAHQISLFRTANRALERSCSYRLKLKTLTQGTVEVDQLACLDIVNMNRSYFYIEYTPRSSTANFEAPGEDRRLSLVDLDNILSAGDDAELQMFLELMDAGDIAQNEVV